MSVRIGRFASRVNVLSVAGLALALMSGCEEGASGGEVSPEYVMRQAAITPPIADNIFASTSQGASASVTLSAHDASNPVTFAIASQPSNGTLSGTSPNLVYTPDAAFSGIDSFTYTASDVNGTSPEATVLVTVNASGVVDQQTKFIAPDYMGGGSLGRCSANQGDTAIVGGAQQVLFYERDAQGSWIEKQRISGPTSYGGKIALDGDYAVVAAPTENNNDGAVYFYEREAGEWVFKNRFATSTFSNFQVLGGSIALSGETAIIGAEGNDDDGPDVGKTFVFSRNTSTGVWEQTHLFTRSDMGTFQKFGAGTAIEGDRVVIGAPEHTSTRGAAYIYERDAMGNWQEIQKLVASDASAGARFGQHVAVSGDTVIVGAFAEDSLAMNSGAAYIFERDAMGNWQEVQKLTEKTPGMAHQFGHGVQLQGDNALIAAPRAGDGGVERGLLYLFKKAASGEWLQYKTLRPTERADNDLFALHPSIDGADIFAGAVGHDGAVNNTGASYNFAVGVNQVPVAIDGMGTVNEDEMLMVTPMGVDPDEGHLDAVLVTQPMNGMLTGTWPDLVYTPDADFNGTDSFTFQITDGFATSNTGTFTIDVLNVNDAPVALDGALITDEDTEGSDLLAATDLDNDPLTYRIVTQPSRGAVTITDSATGAYTYAPDADFNGSDSFTFAANDGALDTMEATVSVTVNAVNDAPESNPGGLTTQKNTPASGTLTASDVDGDALTFALGVMPNNGTVTITDSATGAYTYTPDADFSGSDSFTFFVNDGVVDSFDATIAIEVADVNGAPVVADLAIMADEDTIAMGALVAMDPDGDDLDFFFVTTPMNGTASVSSTGAVTYEPDTNFNGSDSFTVVVNDGALDSAPATVSVTIGAVNDAPFFIAPTPEAGATIEALANDTLSITLAAEDIEGDTLTFLVAGLPSSASLDSATGVITWTPTREEAGDVVLDVEVSDGSAADARSFTVRVLDPELDTDKDGVPDLDEERIGTDPENPDSDNDTISDGFEVGDPDMPTDTDEDGIPDALDDDSDEDGVPDVDEAGDDDLTTDPVDSNADGVFDFLDSDSDGDGVPDLDDNCRVIVNADQADSDEDGVGDACEEGSAPSGGDTEEDGCSCKTAAAPAPTSPLKGLLIASLFGLFFVRRRAARR